MVRRSLALVAGLLLTSGAARAAGPEPADACASAFSAAPDLARAGHLLEARAALIRCASDRCPTKMQPLCADDLRNLESQLPTIVFAAKTPAGDDVLDARVVEEGRVVAERLDGTALPFDPGPHRFRFERPDGASAEVQVLLRENEKGRGVVAVFTGQHAVEPAATPAGTSRPVPWTVWASGGVALAATASFAVFGIHGLDQRSGLSDCKGSCTSEQLQPVRDSYLAANVSLAVAAVATGAAITLFLSRPSIAVAVTGTAAFVRGSF